MSIPICTIIYALVCGKCVVHRIHTVPIVRHATIAMGMVRARVTAHAKGTANAHAMPAIPANIASIVPSIITNHSVMIANCCAVNAMWHVKRIRDALELARRAAVHAEKVGLWRRTTDVSMLMNALAAHTNVPPTNFAWTVKALQNALVSAESRNSSQTTGRMERLMISINFLFSHVCCRMWSLLHWMYRRWPGPLWKMRWWLWTSKWNLHR